MQAPPNTSVDGLRKLSTLITEVIIPLTSNNFVRQRLLKYVREQPKASTPEARVVQQFVITILQNPQAPIPVFHESSTKKIQEYGRELTERYYQEICLQSLCGQNMRAASNVPDTFLSPTDYFRIAGVEPNWNGVGQTWLQGREHFLLKLPSNFRGILELWLIPKMGLEKTAKELKDQNPVIWTTIREAMWRRCIWAIAKQKAQNDATEKTLAEVRARRCAIFVAAFVGLIGIGAFVLKKMCKMHLRIK